MGKKIPEQGEHIICYIQRLEYKGVSGFLIETDDGLILIDALFPWEDHLALIEQGIKDLGCRCEDLKAVLITHGHDDHFGYADVLRERYGCKLYMSRVDFEALYIKPQMGKTLDFEMDCYLEDGEDFTLGDTTIHCVLTPGHTPGSMSFIIPVYDEGEKHYLSIWGGAGLIPGSDKEAYLESVTKFSAVCGFPTYQNRNYIIRGAKQCLNTPLPSRRGDLFKKTEKDH